ncbi:MAG TPA: hypothetical protein VK498_04020 [Ferruginibacter sp.]|nr:hypothetical protein [Ferruginibacter sp.]
MGIILGRKDKGENVNIFKLHKMPGALFDHTIYRDNYTAGN